MTRLYEQILSRFSGLGVFGNHPASFGTFNGHPLSVAAPGVLGPQDRESLGSSFTAYARDGFSGSGVIFGCMSTRLLAFAEIEWKFQRIRDRELFGAPALDPLEHPWPNGSTGELAARMIQDVDLAGNFYAQRVPGGLRRLRPDWVEIISAQDDRGRRLVVGYSYTPGGRSSGADPEFIDVGEVAHWSPLPDPLADWRGMSWLTPVVREAQADGAMVEHKMRFFQNAAVPSTVITFEERFTPEQRQEMIESFRARHEGVGNAYRTLIVDGGGADVTVVGASMEQAGFGDLQTIGEARIAAAAGVPPVIVGLKAGLDAATYSNYAQAVRRFVDFTLRPLWRSASSALASVIEVPDGARLWYDDRHVPALQQDARDAAEVTRTEAITIGELIRGGFVPDTVVSAVDAGDLRRLKHSGGIPTALYPEGTLAGSDAEPADAEDDEGRSVVHALELDDARREVERLRAENERLKKRSLRVVRDDLGLVTGLEEVDVDAG